MAGLCLLDENGAVAQWWELSDHPVAVGRAKTADVAIPDDTLSRRHFLIWREAEGYHIKDLNSQNGTWVDGLRTQMARLRHDVCIVAGRTVFVFRERHSAAAAPPKPGAEQPESAMVFSASLATQP
jgi:pSer/pThr/pTyr-binding forkhead associated (FHA) protein